MMGSESSSYRPKRRPSDSSPEAPNKKRPPIDEENTANDPEDAITQEEIQSIGTPSDNPSQPGKIRNACMGTPSPRFA